ncbi:MAG: hypothetical protein WCF67_25765 [Chitinophagaceae bacterium]
MIQSNYQMAFKLQVLHSYFEQNICKCLQFAPGAITKQLQKRFSCSLRTNINGFEFYINSRQSIPELLNYIAKTTNNNFFDFDLESTDPYFMAFTNVPLDWTGQLVYDSQASADMLTNGMVQLNETLSQDMGKPPGRIIIRFDDIIKYGSDAPAYFNISLQARSTQWQYYFINRSAVSLIHPAIAKASVTFAGPETVTIETGEKALLFSSGDQLLSLSETAKYKFDLVNYNTATGNETEKRTTAPKTIFKALPNPVPARMGIVEVNGKSQASSPMYVYL